MLPRLIHNRHGLTARVILLLTLAALRVHGAANEPWFRLTEKDADLDFVHFNGMSGEFYFPELTGAGGAFVDYDNDGDLDLYLVQGSMLGKGKTLVDASPAARDPRPRHRLFRNDLVLESGAKPQPRFTDVTDSTGLDVTDYGMGVVSADFNNDGWPDLYLANFGTNRMLFNKGDGTFRDATDSSGVGDPLWGIGAAAFDYDRDGWLDLYVVNYVEFDLDENPACYAPSSRRDYCGPSSFKPQPDRLYHNRGDGTFEDVTHQVLVDYRQQPGLGVAITDANNDGWPDIYVANDGAENQLWINRRGTSFVDDALFAGAAVDFNGRAEASMGVAVADFDSDGDEDVFLTHLMGETCTLYVNLGTGGRGLFRDETRRFGLANPTYQFTGFGTAWIDADNDGWLDLFVANGAVRIIEELAASGDPYPLSEPNQFFRNEKGQRFSSVPGFAGADSDLAEVSRGSVFGDVDNDGDVDVVVFNNSGPVRLYENIRGQDQAWVGLRLMGANVKRDLLGTRVGLKRPGKVTLWRRVHTDGSYSSSHDPRITFGLGSSATVGDLEIHWPDGTVETRACPEPLRYTTIRQSTPPPRKQ